MSGSGKVYLFPVENLSRVFREKFIDGLQRLLPIEKAFRKELHRTNWVVYSKEPFAGSMHVVSYLGSHTHRVAISNHRLAGLDGDMKS
ncbi:MAG: transposase [Bacteroidales bacterium]|nr:transposase [Bacteroidales bacterium]